MGSYAKTITATWSADDNSSHEDIDGGQALAANWEGGHPAQVLFGQGPVKAQALRLYPIITASGSSVLSELSATLLVRNCSKPSLPQTSTERCDDLKCRAYCYKTLSCKGSWLNYC